jgi:predicted metal-dependent hydrolase
MFEIFLLFIIIIIIHIFLNINKNNIIYVKSTNGIYTILKDNNQEKKLKLLATIITKMYNLKYHLLDNIDKLQDYDEYIKLLDKNFNKERTVIYETNNQNMDITSFSVNKGEELSICLNSRKTGELHDINLLMYVIIHEMAHFACPEIGHGPLFQKIFKKFIEESINIGIYQYTDYNKYPQEYCGLILNSSIV